MITNNQKQTGESGKSMNSYLAPLVQQIQPSGIRKFLIWLQAAKTLSRWGSASPTSRHPGMSGKPASIRWKEALPAIPLTRGCLSCGKALRITCIPGLQSPIILLTRLLQQWAAVKPLIWRCAP